MSTNSIVQKRAHLFANLDRFGRVLVAYSGGTDSAYLAYAAHRVLGQNMLAVIADSPSLSRAHLRDAVKFAEESGIPHRVITTQEMENPEYTKNDGMRCFHCKDELFRVMDHLCTTLHFSSVAYGMNMDDIGEFRPGQMAARQHHVVAPLAEAELTKREIRQLAQEANLRIWDKPASACLSSRIAYGEPVNRETLQRIERGEEILAEMGFRQFRVRHHGDIVRLEIARDEMGSLFSLERLDRLAAALKQLGYKYVTLDIEGYRSGSMNAVLPASEIRRAPFQEAHQEGRA
ncbi:MAG TPA: ATP-dependent sacrificial sulfur transferase LarE [Acidobacteriaceae bacterium]|nr:ATP-dependent sacrificial sulfur transferase LarE [Acidobacteriaceae bacterium]